MQFQKSLPLITYDAFLDKVKQIENFTSARGRRYEVDAIHNDTLYFRRMDAGETPWDLDLKQTYKAYRELDKFETEDFRPYVERRHPPARGLLLCLELIA
jgi:hypothetical protein